MNSIIRALAVYVFLFCILRASGKRTLKETTPFDFILLLIISESVQEAMTDEDHSLINSFIIISTLVLFDVLLSFIKLKFSSSKKLLEGTPVILVSEGELMEDKMKTHRVEKDDILEAARSSHGLENLQQIKYAILENNGSISIIKKDG